MVVFSLSIITFLARPSILQRDVLELDAEIFRDRLTAGQHRDVLQHGLAAIAEARRLDGGNLETTAETVHNERGQGLAFDVFGDDHSGLPVCTIASQERKKFVQAGELLLVDQDVGIVHFNAHLVGVGDEVGRDVAAVELHAFDDLEFGLERLGFFNRDDALVPTFFMASERNLPISASPLAEMVPT